MTDRKRMHSIPDMEAEGRKRLVLIVEDEFVNREILKAIMEQEYEIICAETGNEAREKIHAQSGTLSLILLDLNLPDMNGLDLLRELKKDMDLSKIPVIVLTADTESEVESLNSGASDFIPKPYPQQEIIMARARRCIELSENRDLIRWTERDHLTGLFNRDYFARYAEQYDQYHRDDPTDALVLDISHFRMMNERFGKAYGDEVLRRIGAELFTFVRENGGIACRREADTFQIYCPHREDYPALAARVASAAGGDDEGRVYIRIGVNPNVDKSGDMERRFDRAKSAADTIRSSRTESVAYYNDDLMKKELDAGRLLDDFRSALAEKQFLVYYQPKYNIQGPHPVLCGAEALVRWKHPTRGMVSPGTFIPLFESNGLIRDLDNYVWREAAEQIRRWKDQLGHAVPVSVNVSRVDILDPDLTETLCGLVRENSLDLQDLHLEITESAYTEDSKQISDIVAGLRNLGFRIEMDDFGSGYSSLNMIITLPIDLLKLDMGFIRSAFSEGGDTGMLKIIMDIARYLSVPMIAEGVETKEQMLTLKDLGCDIVQGYYFSKPVPAEEFEQFIRQEEKEKC